MKKKTLALIGADGQLGLDLQKTLSLSFNLVPLTIKDIDITDKNSIKKSLNPLNAQIIFSTAGYHNVPFCEEDPVNTYLVNTVGTKYLTDWCFYHQAKLVYISTDYVFNGEKQSPYIEEDMPDPINTYGISKYAGEQYIRHNLEEYLIIRTTGLYGSNKCLGKPVSNFVEMFLNLIKGKKEVEFDGREICSPTYTLDLANQINLMLNDNLKGIYHVVNEGYCSWFEFGQKIIEELDIKVKLIKKNRELQGIQDNMDFQLLKRPLNTSLENKKLKSYPKYQMRSWNDAIHRYLHPS